MELDQTKVNQFRNSMLRKGYSLKKIDQYLKTKTTGYGEETSDKDKALISLRKDVENWEELEPLTRRYGGVLDRYEIENEYKAFHLKPGGWGVPKEPEVVRQKWAEGEKTPQTTVYEREVRGNIEKLKQQNATLEDISSYVQQVGYAPEDFSDLLQGYSPQKKKGIGEMFRTSPIEYFKGMFK